MAAGQAFFASATTHTFEADEAAVHPLIASAARRLQNDPDRIYEFVRNTVDVEPTFGLQKGAVGTLTHRSGTPFDQADLMVKLLRAAGYSSARFRFGPANLTAQQCLEWLGTDDAAAVRRILNDGGFPADVAGTTTVTSASFLTAWVEVQIGAKAMHDRLIDHIRRQVRRRNRAHLLGGCPNIDRSFEAGREARDILDDMIARAPEPSRRVLEAAVDAGEVDVAMIMERTGFSRPYVYRLLQKLAEAGQAE